MIDRYSRPEMSAIWSEEGKYRRWLEVELAVCEIQCERGLIPRDALDAPRAKASVDPARVDEIERQVRHDVIAFLKWIRSEDERLMEEERIAAAEKGQRPPVPDPAPVGKEAGKK